MNYYVMATGAVICISHQLSLLYKYEKKKLKKSLSPTLIITHSSSYDWMTFLV